MIRRGDLKFVHCPADPDQLYDLAADPHERTNLASDAERTPAVAELPGRSGEALGSRPADAEVLADQARRRLVASALRPAAFTPWDYTPPAMAASEYMRNHLDLNDVERDARWPRADERGQVQTSCRRPSATS